MSALWMAEDPARELPNLPLEDALQLVHLYVEQAGGEAVPRALPQRRHTEHADVAKVTASLAKRFECHCAVRFVCRRDPVGTDCKWSIRARACPAVVFRCPCPSLPDPT